MVETITAGRDLSPRVTAVMGTIARHAFVPDAPPEHAYREDETVIIKSRPDGTALSCASAPWLVATMLDALDVRPRDRVLEIGAGTGYNAALLAELAGPAGQVVTMDIDGDVTAHARARLDAAGYPHVRVVTGDGVHGVPDAAPYQRIIATVGPWDIPTSWRRQLAFDGRMVVPLRWRGTTRAVAFTRDGDLLRSDWIALCGFVPMLGQDAEHHGHLDPDGHVTLCWDRDQPVDLTMLSEALGQPKTTLWSRATVGPQESFEGVWLRLSSAEPGTCRITANQAAVAAGLCTPGIPKCSPVILDASSFAYFAMEPVDAERRHWRLGAIGHGPHGRHLAERFCDQITAWDNDRTAQPTILGYPADTTELPPDAVVIDKPGIRLTVTFPPAAATNGAGATAAMAAR
jgi:protein-L-isoaspartate(D-aspartate) O-methyltransferase